MHCWSRAYILRFYHSLIMNASIHRFSLHATSSQCYTKMQATVTQTGSLTERITVRCIWLNVINGLSINYIRSHNVISGCIYSPQTICLWPSIDGSSVPLMTIIQLQSNIPFPWEKSKRCLLEKAIALEWQGIFTIATYYRLRLVLQMIWWLFH